MRYAFVQELTALASQNKDLILLTGDLGFTVFEEFAKSFPKQFFNVGIAESNMVGLAAGLALSGKNVFVYSIATFATYRPFEFIRNDICLHKLPVTIVGSGAGLSYGDAGPTHHGLEDIALMRSLPNMTILCPGDPAEANWATRESLFLRSPVYLRLGRSGEPSIYSQKPKLKIGVSSCVRKGSDLVVFATGNIVFNAKLALDLLDKDNIHPTLYSMHTLKPIDKRIVTDAAMKAKYIVTIEEHRKIGGLGTAVAEIISQLPGKCAQQCIIGVDDNFTPRLGNQEYLRTVYGLSPQKIAGTIRKFINFPGKASIKNGL